METDLETWQSDYNEGTRSLNFCEGEWCGHDDDDDDDEVMLNVLRCQLTY